MTGQRFEDGIIQLPNFPNISSVVRKFLITTKGFGFLNQSITDITMVFEPLKAILKVISFSPASEKAWVIHGFKRIR